MSSYRLQTKDGIVTVTTLTKISPERVMQYLYKGSFAAQLGRVTDNTPNIPKDVKSLLVKAESSS